MRAGTHAREWLGPATALHLIHHLVEADLPTPEVDLLDLDWYVLPVVNPDGYAFTWDVDRLWRKTR